jgi:putative methyltransferase (TIGR04325 family)
MSGWKTLPLVKQALAWRYRRYFATQENTNLFYGVYPTFAAATADLPKTKPEGYDNEAPAAMYTERLNRVFLADYPLLFWLRAILPDVRRLYDFGGHVGIAFYAYQNYLTYPPELRWEVYDVPAVREAGRKLAASRRATQIAFSNHPSEADGADVFLASGSLQYVEAPGIGAMLAAMKQKPKHVLVNKTPLHDTEAFVTLQNIGTAFCPYRIFKRSEFMREVQDQGYDLVDAWPSSGSCPIPQHPAHSVAEYSGAYFRLRC